ncbi:hypothetical protein LARI1_G008960 [Lachnellula arida]|uniref:Uncharacterized protein n=1 Tax=Lachnellula arida TaxID=1316785 RepID=A0A8T9B751_9HELO|nr:hypothetical protein LARI1_G008960 [Lachnellula arida]
MTVGNVLNADVPGIMNIEDAKSELQSEREAYVTYFVKKKKQPVRRVQNRINKCVSRWKTFFYLDTVEDYRILACKIQDMREGRAKRREGRPRRPEDRSKRRTSQRLADKRRKPDADKSEEDSLFDSGIDFGFDHLDTALPSEEDVNISTETSTSHPSVASSRDEFAHSLSNEIDSTSDSISSNLFDFCDSQTLSQYSNISSLADETWCHSDDMSDPASMSGMLYSGTNIAGDRWIGSLQQDICDGSSMNFEWQGVPESHGPVIQPVIHHAIKSASNTAGNRMQQPKQIDEAQLCMLLMELKSQLHEGRRDTIQTRPTQSRRPLAERDDLAPLIEQCLTTLREPTTCMSVSGNKGAGARQEDSGPERRYGAEVEMRVAYLWNALTVEFCRIPSSVT